MPKHLMGSSASEKIRAWQIKHPEATRVAPAFHPDDSNHTRHKLRQLYRQAEEDQMRAARKEAHATQVTAPATEAP